MDQPPIQYQIVQAEMNLQNLEKVDVSQFAPPTALSLKIRVSVDPPSGAVIIFTPGQQAQAVRFDGSTTEGDVSLSGPFIYVQRLQGTVNWKIEAMGYVDNVNAH